MKVFPREPTPQQESHTTRSIIMKLLTAAQGLAAVALSLCLATGPTLAKGGGGRGGGGHAGGGHYGGGHYGGGAYHGGFSGGHVSPAYHGGNFAHGAMPAH